MTTITIDDREYDTDNFTQEQLGLLNEANMCNAELGRYKYSAELFDTHLKNIVGKLTESLDGDDQKELGLS